MGTTKDPEGFRRHTAGRGDVLGIKGGGPKRRGCGLGVALLVAALALAVAARVILMRSDRDGRAAVAGAVPASGSAIGTTGPIPDDVPPSRGSDALSMLPQSIEVGSTERRLPLTADSHEPASARESSASAPIRLLRGWSDAPFADAEVFWIGKAELARLRKNGLMITTVELEPVLRRLGRHETSGPDGLLRVAADGGHLLVLGEGWQRELEVSPDLLGITDVRVFAPRTLAVDVVDWRGAPALAVPVELSRVDVQGRPQRSLFTLPTSPVTGSLRFEDVDTLGQPLPAEPPPPESTRLRVALDPDLAPAAWVEIDLADDPLPHVRLQLPPLGELRVLVAQNDGRPVDWGGRVELLLAEGQGHALAQELVGGRAAFGNLRFGQALRVRAVRADGAQGEERQVAALTAEEPEREVVLQDVAPQPRLVMRPIHPDGFALPRTWCDVRLEAHDASTEVESNLSPRKYRLEGTLSRGGSVEHVFRTPLGESALRPAGISYHHALLTDSGGFLDLPLPSGFLGWSELTVVVSLVRDGTKLSSAARSLARGEAWADMDLGSVHLLRPAPPAEGSK